MNSLLETRTLPLKRAKRLRGSPVLSGDLGLAEQALIMAALAKGTTRLEHAPASEAWQQALTAASILGVSAEGSGEYTLLHTEVSEGDPTPASASPIEVPDENFGLLLAGVLAGRGVQATLSLNRNRIGLDVLRTLAVTYPGSLDPALFEGKANPTPAATPEALLEPAGDLDCLWTPKSMAKKVQQTQKPYALGLDEGLAKPLRLAHALAAREELQLRLREPGHDLLEILIAQFHGAIQVDRNEPPEGDELARRIARQMRAAGKQEDLVGINLPAGVDLTPQFISLPRDVSEASVYALCATLIKGSDILLENVLLNTSRTTFFTALRRMGADIEVVTRRERHGFTYGNLRVRSSELLGKRFSAENLVAMRDEAFLLLVAAAFAEGETVIRDVTYLRGYHWDLLKVFLSMLKTAGVEAGEIEDGAVIRGRSDYDGGTYDAYGHSGLAAALMVLAIKSHGESTLTGGELLDWRFPGLLNGLEGLMQEKPEKVGEKSA